jgi:hypothetical protein
MTGSATADDKWAHRQVSTPQGVLGLQAGPSCLATVRAMIQADLPEPSSGPPSLAALVHPRVPNLQ